MQLFAVIVASAVLLHASAEVALAQDETNAHEAEAQRLFEHGRALYEQHQLAAAIDAFRESDRLSPTANVAFNIAQTSELIGRFDDAFNWYQRCLGYGADDAAAEAAQQRANSLLDRVAVLEIRVAPPNARLSIDETALETAAPDRLRIAVPPGEHSVTARAEGYRAQTIDVEAVRGARVGVTVNLERTAGVLHVTSTPTGALVLRCPELVVLGRTPLTISVPAADLQLVLRLDGYEDKEASASVLPERTAELALSLQRQPPKEARDAGALAADDKATGLGDARWVGYGMATALLATGIGLGIAAINRKNEVESDPMRRGRDAVDHLNIAADLTGGAGLLTAAVTFVLDVGVLGVGPVHAK